MKIAALFSFALCLLACSSPEPKPHQTLTPKPPVSRATTAQNDTTPRVTGIGGIFFSSENDNALERWYGHHLGIALDQYGSPFEFRNALRPEETNYLRWDITSTDSEFYAPSLQQFMINYRVQNIEGLVRNLRASNAEILDSIVSYPYGKFVHLLDPAGNKIELWEPVDSVLTALGGVTTK